MSPFQRDFVFFVKVVQNHTWACLKLLIGYSIRGYQIELMHLFEIFTALLDLVEKKANNCDFKTSIVCFVFSWHRLGKSMFLTLAIEICRIEKDIVFL